MHNFPQESHEAELLVANSRSITSDLCLDIAMKKVKWKATWSIMKHSLSMCQDRQMCKREHPRKNGEVAQLWAGAPGCLQASGGNMTMCNGVTMTMCFTMSQTRRLFAALKLRRKHGGHKIFHSDTESTHFPHLPSSVCLSVIRSCIFS